MERLTTAERATYEHLLSQYPSIPTVREMAKYFGVCATTIQKRIEAMESKGYIKRDPGKARSITVLCPGCAPVWVPEDRVASVEKFLEGLESLTPPCKGEA
jgi:DNA-binding transcriptional MocR family regulator